MRAGISSLLETYFFIFTRGLCPGIFVSSLAGSAGLLCLAQWHRVKKSTLSFRGVQAGIMCSEFDIVYSQP